MVGGILPAWAVRAGSAGWRHSDELGFKMKTAILFMMGLIASCAVAAPPPQWICGVWTGTVTAALWPELKKHYPTLDYQQPGICRHSFMTNWACRYELRFPGQPDTRGIFFSDWIEEGTFSITNGTVTIVTRDATGSYLARKGARTNALSIAHVGTRYELASSNVWPFVLRRVQDEDPNTAEHGTGSARP